MRRQPERRFLFRLALSLGKTVGELLHDLDKYGGGPTEFVEWMAYCKVEPFGYDMDNWRMGVVASTIANCTPRGPGAKRLKPADFAPVTKAGGDLPARVERELEQRAAAKQAGAPPLEEIDT